ncbi:beta-ketoacyl-[acyl-carrier-protein] synthase family protein [Streptomyces sp. NRRL F-2664]|uniref:beta-ketoacyl-[acyl-carrier-protein] synthase family protein n=1 Tax=Streptomyces sp. NRRL F-2664 TaxID=1463842 RepID=UPI0004C96B0E|nr:beta-ketoacyl synthase N-terminal-like domain-containing protein [Streptomyces sp. NRRL F-2664]
MRPSATADVFVTGIGAVSCLGATADAFWTGLQAAAAPPTPVRGLTERVPDVRAYQVPDADGPADAPDGALGRAARFALSAAREAVGDAGLAAPEIAEAAVVIGTAVGESGGRESGPGQGGDRDGGGAGAVPAAAGPWEPMFSVAAAVGAELSTFGTNISVSNACAASGYALSVAVDMIRRGEADTVLLGGAEGISRVPLAGFSRLGAVDPEACRPFDAGRRGTVFGEGAAVLVLQSARAAAGRPVYGRVLGTAWSCDAHHPTAPDPGGEQLVRVARAALTEAGCGPADVGCVIPHGTGTRQNDVVEYQVLREVLGDRVADTPLFSLKAFIGHTAGAAAAFAAVSAALMARHGRIPANVPLAEPDPQCPVRLPQDGPTPLRQPHVLVNAYAFGGSNFTMVFGGGER